MVLKLVYDEKVRKNRPVCGVVVFMVDGGV